MSLCLAASGKTAVLAVHAFSLIWTHSVEKIEWKEHWRVSREGLSIESASVEGTGAGMEIPDGARLVNGAWVYEPALGLLPEIVLADAGLGRDWTICTDQECRKLHSLVGSAGDAVRIWSCDSTARETLNGDPQ